MEKSGYQFVTHLEKRKREPSIYSDYYKQPFETKVEKMIGIISYYTFFDIFCSSIYIAKFIKFLDEHCVDMELLNALKPFLSPHEVLK